MQATIQDCVTGSPAAEKCLVDVVQDTGVSQVFCQSQVW